MYVIRTGNIREGKNFGIKHLLFTILYMYYVIMKIIQVYYVLQIVNTIFRVFIFIHRKTSSVGHRDTTPNRSGASLFSCEKCGYHMM